ncbi:MAG: 4Fe-4S binding protein [Muricomes sp.]|uniref:ATP-binding protein n=1 Tax=Faecalicatena contorta TaxID=39482 RepID=UPI002EBAF573|nr:4Fe-4S binding protein [Muricomes sp.]
MIRRIIEINEEKCNGCGLCAEACHEGAIGMVNGKARLLRDDYCDGLGDCLPACPADAIRFVEREAAAYDAEAVKAHQKHKITAPLPCGCPGTQARELRPHTAAKASAPSPAPTESQLRQWPVQIKLVPVQAPYYENAELLIAADCTAYAYAGFHQDFMKGKITLMGCPKLDSIDYTEKLTEIIRQNTIKNVTVVRMEVPCCGGIEQAVVNAVQNSGKKIPYQIITLSTQGKIL